MSVEFTPVKNGCFSFGVSNGSWFAMLDGPLKELLPNQHSNDPIVATDDQAKQCAEAILGWTPGDDWFGHGLQDDPRKMFIDFFNDCGGFETT